MAKRNYKKQSLAKRVGIAILCVLIVAVVGLCSAWGTGYALTGELNPGKWVKADAPDKEKPSVPDVDYENPDVAYGKYGFLIINTADAEGAPVALTATTRNVDGKVTEVVTANVTPVNADVFGVVWKPSDSSKVVVTPIDGDKLSARLTCVARFNTPITITCEVYSTTTLTATCTVDCLRQTNGDFNISIQNANG